MTDSQETLPGISDEESADTTPPTQDTAQSDDDSAAPQGQNPRLDAAKPVIDHLNTVSTRTGYDLGRVFERWVGLLCAAFEGDNETHTEIIDDLASHCTDPDEAASAIADAFAKALGELSLQHDKTGQPVLGDVYMVIGRSSDRLGQFFTPYNVAKMMAEVQLLSGRAPEDATPADPLTIADSSCGSARLLVAAALKIDAQTNEPVPIYVQGTDIDPICAKMAAINLTMFSIPGRIYHGDSLSGEMHAAWEVAPPDSTDTPADAPPLTRIDPDDRIPPEASE